MPRSASATILAIVLISTVPATAQHGALDLVPSDTAVAAIVVRDLDELIKKGDKFINDTGFRVPLRPSDLFREAVGFLGIRDGLDERGSAGILLLRPERDGDSIGLRDLEELLAGTMPFTDLDKMAANFGFEAGKLKPKMIGRGKAQGFGTHFYARNKNIFLANSEKTLQRIAKSKTLAEELSPAERKMFGQADILFHFSPRGLDKEWESFLDSSDVAQLATESLKGDEGAEQVLKQLRATMGSLRFVSGGVRLDDGLSLNLLGTFPKDGPAKEFLASLRAGKKGSALAGLPDGNVVAAQANVGEGARNVLIARIALNAVLRNFLETQQIISATDRPSFVGVFSEIWQRLQGSRFAVYLTRDENKLGLFSVVAMLDADDAKKLLGDMKTLAKIADGSVLDLQKTAKTEEIDIAKVVNDLGDKVYRVREGATTKLRLLGEPALPYLEKAIKASKDLETVRRAERLWSQISQVAAERRKELLGKKLPRFARPSFAFVPVAETRAGYPVHVVKVKLADQDTPFNKHMQQLLGPQWDHIRLAIHGDQIVALLGSEVELFDAALTNLKEGKPGLAAHKSLKGFGAHARADRIGEFHLSVQSLLALIQPGRAPPAPGQLSSFSLAVDEDRMQVDLFMPAAEVRRIAKENPF